MTCSAYKRTFFAIFLVTWTYASTVAWCQSSMRKLEPLTISDALDVQYFSDFAPVDFSPDGAFIAIAVRENRRNRDISPEDLERAGIPHYGSASEIYLQERRTGNLRKLTDGFDNWLPTWSPDGQRLAFFSDRKGTGVAQLWIWDRSSNAMRCVLQRGVRGNQIAWLDPNSLVVMVRPGGDDEAERLTEPESSIAPSAVRGGDSGTATVHEFRTSEDNGNDKSAGPWSLDRYLGDLVRVDLRPNHAILTLVHSTLVSSFYASPDRARIAYASPVKFESPDSQQIIFDIEAVNITTAKSQKIVSNIRMGISGREFRWSPDGKWISFQTGGMSEDRYDCFVVDSETGQQWNVTQFRDQGWSGAAPLWDRESHLLFLRNGELWSTDVERSAPRKLAGDGSVEIKQIVSNGVNQPFETAGEAKVLVFGRESLSSDDHLYSVDTSSGKVTQFGRLSGCFDCVVGQSSIWVTPDHQSLAMIRETGDIPPEIWSVDLNTGAESQLTTLNAPLDRYLFGKTRIVRWLGDDGQNLAGTLLLPAGYIVGRRYPLIVWVYGNAKGSKRVNWFGTASNGPLNMQLLATRGFAILWPDAPQKVGTPMLDLSKTVLPGVNAVIAMGIADPVRIGIIGHSNGGCSTISLIVQTQRFRAAVMIAGTSSLISLYGEMDRRGSAYGVPLDEKGQGSMGGTPWSSRERYIENSPFFYLDRVTTPLLIAEGGADEFIQPYQTDELFVAMRRLGKTSDYVRYDGAGHDPAYWSYANQQDLASRLIKWFEHHLSPPD